MPFQHCIDRRVTNSIKWNPELVAKWCNLSGDDLLSYWVADMDYHCPAPITQAVQAVAASGLYGYCDMTSAYYDSVIGWYARRMQCTVQRDWICYSNGVVPALNYILQEFCQAGDKVIIQPPVYYPFAQAAQNNGVGLLCNELQECGDQYVMDFDDLEQKARDPRAQVMFLCSPHNPVGRVWTTAELLRVADICKRNHVLLVADEIHCDIVFAPAHFSSMLGFEPYLDNLIVCSSPSKSFNIAGLQTSNIIIPSDEIRTRFRRVLQRNSVLLPNAFGPAAVQAAYTDCDDWLAQLLVALQQNLDALHERLASKLPAARLVRPQGTYLAWIDMSSYPYDHLTRATRLGDLAHLALDHGHIFGSCGERFERINFACPTQQMLAGIDRMASVM